MRPQRATTASWAIFGDEAVVYQHGLRRLQRLNPTATAVWTELDGRRDVGEIVDDLAGRYDTPPPELLADVETVLAEYGGLGLLEGIEATDEPPPAAPVLAPRPESASALVEPMEGALDAVEWAADLGPYQGLGFEFCVRVEDAELGDYLRRVLASLAPGPEAQPVRDVGRYSVRGPHRRSSAYRIYFGASRIHSTTSPAASAEYLLWHLNRMVIDADDEHTLFHAAGACASGRGILVPGQMNAGKSTLVTGLVRSGLGYLTDEAVAIDHATGELLPFPKAIGLDRGSWTVLPEYEPEPDSPAERFQTTRWQVPADEVRRGSVSGRVPLGWIVTTKYEVDADTEIEELAPADALSLLLEQAFGLGDGDETFHALAELVEQTPAYQLVSGDLDSAVEAVRGVVGQG